MPYPRRTFLRHTAKAGLGLLTVPTLISGCGSKTTQSQTSSKANRATGELPFKLSLAQWSLHRHFFDGGLNPLDFPKITRQEFGYEAVEFVNQFFMDRVEDNAWLDELKQRSADFGVETLWVMVDNAGDLGDYDDATREKAIEEHRRWLAAAGRLGCRAIRVNAAGRGDAQIVQEAAIDGIGRLSEYAGEAGMHVLIENHGGYSGDGGWLSGIIQQIDRDNCGTLVDFGNFCIRKLDGKCAHEYDRYFGVKELMRYAKGVSAKTYDFDEAGQETTIDFQRMLQMVKDAGYKGYVGIEYEGERLDEYAGIRATEALIRQTVPLLD